MMYKCKGIYELELEIEADSEDEAAQIFYEKWAGWGIFTPDELEIELRID